MRIVRCKSRWPGGLDPGLWWRWDAGLVAFVFFVCFFCDDLSPKFSIVGVIELQRDYLRLYTNSDKY